MGKKKNDDYDLALNPEWLSQQNRKTRFGLLLKAIRKKLLDTTLSGVSELTGISMPQLSQYENGVTPVGEKFKLLRDKLQSKLGVAFPAEQFEAAYLDAKKITDQPKATPMVEEFMAQVGPEIAEHARTLRKEEIVSSYSFPPSIPTLPDVYIEYDRSRLKALPATKHFGHYLKACMKAYTLDMGLLRKTFPGVPDMADVVSGERAMPPQIAQYMADVFSFYIADFDRKYFDALRVKSAQAIEIQALQKPQKKLVQPENISLEMWVVPDGEARDPNQVSNDRYGR